MTPQCLNNFLLYIHKQETDSLGLISIAREFVSHTLDVKVIFNLAMSIKLCDVNM